MAPVPPWPFPSGGVVSIQAPPVPAPIGQPERPQHRPRPRGPGERVNAELKNWKILRKIRSSPNRAAELVAAVQTLMIANA
jgi:hypothetical protein